MIYATNLLRRKPCALVAPVRFFSNGPSKGWVDTVLRVMGTLMISPMPGAGSRSRIKFPSRVISMKIHVQWGGDMEGAHFLRDLLSRLLEMLRPTFFL